MIANTPFTSGIVDVTRLTMHPLFACYLDLLDHVRRIRPTKSIAVGVTSSRAGEGVTTLAVNLAICAAFTGHAPILLVDTRTVPGELAGLFGITEFPGFTELLSETANLDACLHESRIPGLTVIGSGSKSARSTVSPSQISAILATLKARFELVIFDLPPVATMSSHLALASSLDGLLMVIEAGSTDASEVQRACKRLAVVDATVIGAVLNKYSANGNSSRTSRWLR